MHGLRERGSFRIRNLAEYEAGAPRSRTRSQRLISGLALLAETAGDDPSVCRVVAGGSGGISEHGDHAGSQSSEVHGRPDYFGWTDAGRRADPPPRRPA